MTAPAHGSRRVDSGQTPRAQAGAPAEPPPLPDVPDARDEAALLDETDAAHDAPAPAASADREAGPDWTAGPAKLAAVAVLGAASVVGIAWSIFGRDHQPHWRVPLEATATVNAGSNANGADAPAPNAGGQRASGSRPAARPGGGQPSPLANLIDLNTATQAELESLPGIGPALAQRIIDDRTALGPFATVEDLDRVRGIGPRTLERLRDLVRVGAPPEPAQPGPADGAAEPGSAGDDAPGAGEP